jgi:hypothetical protein
MEPKAGTRAIFDIFALLRICVSELTLATPMHLTQIFGGMSLILLTEQDGASMSTGQFHSHSSSVTKLPQYGRISILKSHQ